MNNFEIRFVKKEDINDLLNIYSYYVLNTAISFDIPAPTKDFFINLINDLFGKYPFLVALDNNKIVGYAYTHPYIKREAYNHGAEITIYIDPNYKKNGLGKKLYSILENISVKQNIIRLYACVGVTDKPDEYLNNNSFEFHKHLGYKQIACFKESGYKFNKLYDMVWLEKQIADIKNVSKFIPVSELNLLEGDYI